MKQIINKMILLILIAILIKACSIDRLFQPSEPPLAPVTGTKDDIRKRQQIVRLPLPQKQKQKYAANSLWRKGALSFFKDKRATRVGDIIQVNVSFTDQASISNSTSLNRSSANDSNINALGGVEDTIKKILPGNPALTPLNSTNSSKSNSGTGSIDRSETLNFTMAAIVNQKLPNGNLVIIGRQEVRVNFEKRELVIAGVIRPDDIDATNSIDSDKIAEARISYGGKGDITELQKPRYGDKILDVILPF